MSPRVVTVVREGRVAVVTLDRADAMNALSSGLRAALAATLRTLEADAAVRAIVLTGAGDRAFSAGLDLKELGADDDALMRAIGPDPDANPVAALLACTKPVIAAINGVAITGGLELALACDILIAANTARFADTHVKVGVMPGWGLSQRLPRLIGVGRAKEMSLTGRMVDAPTALAWGLVNQVVAPDALLSSAVAIGAAIGAHDPAMVARYKSLIDRGMTMPLADALAFESEQALFFNARVGRADIEARRETVRASNKS